MRKSKIHEDQDIDLEDAPILKPIIERLENNTIHLFRTEASYPEFKMIVEICYKAMIHSQHWKRNHTDLEISGMLQIADETLALIVLENNYLEWQEIANGRKVDKDNRLTKYTNKGLRHNGTKKGWTSNGMKRFNTIFERLKLDREKEESKLREKELMEDWCSRTTGRRGNHLVEEMPGLTDAEDIRVVTCTDFDYE